MKVKIQGSDKVKVADLSDPIDISICLVPGKEQLKAWYVEDARIEAVKTEGWVGEVKHGAPVNFRNIFFNPHGHGTHTECLGHISLEDYFISDCLKQFWFEAVLVTIEPVSYNGDLIITPECFPADFNLQGAKALVTRTLPNGEFKKVKNYCDSNPAYFTSSCIKWLNKIGVEHLLTDLPSVDKEKDNGVLAAHHEFWTYPDLPQIHKTITEFIYVPDYVKDGLYLLEIQVANFQNDASPSRPLLYKYD